jgi:hypothetical protein
LTFKTFLDVTSQFPKVQPIISGDVLDDLQY